MGGISRRQTYSGAGFASGVCRSGFYIEEEGLSCLDYRSDPEEMVRVQPEVARRHRELPISETMLGVTPASWTLNVDFWPIITEAWLGCDVEFSALEPPRVRPAMPKSREELLRFETPDPRFSCGARP